MVVLGERMHRSRIIIVRTFVNHYSCGFTCLLPNFRADNNPHQLLSPSPTSASLRLRLSLPAMWSFQEVYFHYGFERCAKRRIVFENLPVFFTSLITTYFIPSLSWHPETRTPSQRVRSASMGKGDPADGREIQRSGMIAEVASRFKSCS